MRSIVARPLTSVLCLAAAMCATFAWTGFVYLRTWADPATPGRVVSAVLDDSAARAEVIDPFEQRLRSMVAGDGLTPDQVSTALDAVLSDAGVRDRLAEAFAPVDGGLNPRDAIDVVRSAVAGVEPRVADRIDTLGPELELDLPGLSVGDGWRAFAERWVLRIAFVAVGFFLLSFLVGDRRRTARNLGLWAFGVGLSWWLGPLLIGAAARRWASSVDAVAAVVVDTYVEPIRPWAILLSTSGTLLLVTALTVGATSWLRTARAESGSAPGSVATATAAATTTARAAAVPGVHPDGGSGHPTGSPVTPAASAPFSAAGVHAPPNEVLGDPATMPTGRLARTTSPALTSPGPSTRDGSVTRSPTDDVDVWALYASPTAAAHWPEASWAEAARSPGSADADGQDGWRWSRPSDDDGAVGDPDHTLR